MKTFTGETGAIRLTGANDVVIDSVQTGSYGQAQTITADALGGELRAVTVRRYHTGGYLAAIKVDGRLLVDPSVASGIDVNDAKVISKDEDANTITVDGGTWTTSDKLVSGNALRHLADGC